MSSIKPEVHNISQHRRRRTEPRPQGIRTKNFMKIDPAVPEMCSWTDRQTNWSQYSAPLPGRSNNSNNIHVSVSRECHHYRPRHVGSYHVSTVCYYQPRETCVLCLDFEEVTEKCLPNSRCWMTETTSGSISSGRQLSQQRTTTDSSCSCGSVCGGWGRLVLQSLGRWTWLPPSGRWSGCLILSPPIPLRLYTLPYWSNPPFLIFDIRALWRSVVSARSPECQKLKICLLYTSDAADE